MERDRTQHLAELMEQRRLALRLEWNEVAVAAGISAAFLRKIRSGTSARPLTIAKLEAALNWAPGSIDSILAGGEPTDLSAPTTGASTPKPQRPQDVEAAIRDLAQRLSPERMRSIFADLSRSERKYEDDAEQRLWEITEIEPVIRRQLIGLLRVAREAMEDEDPEINAEVREFRPRR
ncbi:hypothetical protein ABZ897_00360 [Nonomuraea sp. NPDC046802]|uniref:hypothetical protein n=1 Tax=Nonomuraea sp. NPDC046802 TaxID=3154919 RepID=UPI0033CFC93A